MPHRNLSLALVLLAALLAEIRAAEAGCALPDQVEFAPASGTLLPNNGTVLVFIRGSHPLYPKDEPSQPRAFGPSNQELAAKVEALENDSQMRIHRVDLEADRGPVRVEVAIGDKTYSASYRIGQRSRSDRTQPTQITAAEYVFERRGDPPSEAFILEIKPRAPAYRIETSEGKTFVVPDRRNFVRSPSKHRGFIIAGRLGCADLTVPAAPFDFELTPLFASGEAGSSHSPSCITTRGGGFECGARRAYRFRGRVDSD